MYLSGAKLDTRGKGTVTGEKESDRGERCHGLICTVVIVLNDGWDLAVPGEPSLDVAGKQSLGQLDIHLVRFGSDKGRPSSEWQTCLQRNVSNHLGSVHCDCRL